MGDAQRFWGAFSSILVYQWGGFEIVPGIPLFLWWYDDGYFADENDNNAGHYFSKNGLEMGWFSHTTYDRVCFFFFFFFFLVQYTGIEMINILKSTLSIPVKIFSKNPPRPASLLRSIRLDLCKNFDKVENLKDSKDAPG